MAIARSKTIQLLIIIALEMAMLVKADYRIGWSINTYSNPTNTLSDGSSCTTDGICRTTLRLCFRSANHSHSDVESDCTQLRNREFPGFFSAPATSAESIEEYYPGQFQIYVRVSHSVEEDRSMADFDLPFTDPLIDDIFIEANVTAVNFTDGILNSQVYTVTGDFGVATLKMAVHVRCAQNYFGSACEMLCESDGTNCSTALSPPPTGQPSTTTEQPTAASTAPLGPSVASTVNVVGIAVGVTVGLLLLILLGVGNVILILYFLKRNKKASWSPKRNTTGSLSMERVERDLTSNKINRISYISDDGSEVEYTVVNKPKSPPPALPPPYTLELTEDDEMGPDYVNTPSTKGSVKESGDPFEGYEPINFQGNTATKESSHETEKSTASKTEAIPAKPKPKAKGTDGSGYDTIDFGSPSTKDTKPIQEATYTNLPGTGNGAAHYQSPRSAMIVDTD